MAEVWPPAMSPWQEGLPELKPKKPWYGTPTPLWSEEYEEEARLALEERHYETGDKLAKQRVKNPAPPKIPL